MGNRYQRCDVVLRRRKWFLFLLFLVTSYTSTSGQIKGQAHAGISYIEHLSIGAGFTLADQHSVAIFFGSNFFRDIDEFANFYIQYNWIIHRLKFAGLTPTIGLKGGQSIYTDDYYTWELASVLPFIGVQYPLTDKLELIGQAGAAFSFEQSVKRVRYGEVGHYKEVLPELKIGIVYTLGGRHR